MTEISDAVHEAMQQRDAELAIVREGGSGTMPYIDGQIAALEKAQNALSEAIARLDTRTDPTPTPTELNQQLARNAAMDGLG